MTGSACVVQHLNTSASGAWAVPGQWFCFFYIPAFSISSPTQCIFRPGLWDQLWNESSQWIMTSVFDSLFRLTLIIIRFKDEEISSAVEVNSSLVLCCLPSWTAHQHLTFLFTTKAWHSKTGFLSFSFVLFVLYPTDFIQCLSQGVQHLLPLLTAVLGDLVL